MPLPPSVLSYYADIDQHRRTALPTCARTTPLLSALTGENQQTLEVLRSGCSCATNLRGWAACDGPPFARDHKISAARRWLSLGEAAATVELKAGEDVALVSCLPWPDVDVHVRVARQQHIVEQYRRFVRSRSRPESLGSSLVSSLLSGSQSPAATAPSPNVVIVEIDSIAAAYADRHLPLTRRFLQSLRAEEDPSSPVASFVFPLFNAVGAATLHNGFASLAGCAAVYSGDGPRKRSMAQMEQWLPGFTMFDLGDERVHQQSPAVKNPPPVEAWCQHRSTATATTAQDRNRTPTQPSRALWLTGAGAKREPHLHRRHRPTQGQQHQQENYRQLQQHHDQTHATHHTPLPTRTPTPPPPPPLAEGGGGRRRRGGTRGSRGGGGALKQRGARVLGTKEVPAGGGGEGAGERVVNPWLFEVAKRRGYVTLHDHEFCADGSPYVVHSYFERAGVLDHVLDHLFCRLGTRSHVAADWKTVEGHCLAGHFRHSLPLQHIESLFDAYPDVPKLAFVNSIVAHDYSTRWDQMALKPEELDRHLVQFLARMLARQDATNTVVVLRGDHGLQGGPSTLDYATQVEQRRPMLEILIPKQLLHHSHSHSDGHSHSHGHGNGNEHRPSPLEINQGRLVTAFDVYTTLLNLIAPDADHHNHHHHQRQQHGPPKPRRPPWGVDLLREVVAADRTCRDAHVPVDFCACTNELTDEVSPAYPGGSPQSPHFGVCNFASFAEQSNYCVAPFL